MNLAPLWAPGKGRTRYPSLDRDLTVDVAIIGAGITGLTLAWRLKEIGLRVAVVEMRSVGEGATGHSTGHLTSSLDVDYTVLQRRFGHLGAVEAATKSTAAIAFIQDMVARNRIACDFRRADGWRFGAPGQEPDFTKELEVARSLGLAVELVERGPYPFMGRSLRFQNQAMFDPAAYVRALAALVDGGGDHIFEDTTVERIEEGDPCRVETGRHVIEAEYVVQATHVPIGVSMPMQARVAPYMSYVIAARLDGPVPPDLYWDTANPYHYLRPALDPDGAPLLVVGGEDHKVGQEPDPESRFASLEQFVRDRFPVASVDWRWAWEVFEPVDGLAYLGRMGTSRRVFAATGFAGTGLTFGTTAALDISDQIVGSGNAQSVFRARRYKPFASARTFLAENANVAWRLVRDQLRSGAPLDEAALQPGEGRITRVDGETVACYRTPGGQLRTLSPVCTHMGGRLQWNAAAGTWDCPLHGSRFQATGEVLAGPAVRGLAPGGSLEPGREVSVSDLVSEWQERGYTCELVADPDGKVRCRTPGHEEVPERGAIEAFHRFEGMSDPDEMCVVIAMRLPRDDGQFCRGVVVLGFGPSAAPEDKEAFASMKFDPDARTLPS